MVYFNQDNQSNDTGLGERKSAISYGGAAVVLGGGKPRVIGGRKAVRPWLTFVKKSTMGRQVAENLTEI